jgi:hypothetical protein
MFDISFFPGSVGCTANIVHIESGEILDLTKDVVW